MADVMNMPIKVARAEQCVALGAAMFAATASGIYSSVEDAKKAMGQGFEKVYYPIKENVEIYNKLYSSYLKIGKAEF
jgi:L-ribulokinase